MEGVADLSRVDGAVYPLQDNPLFVFEIVAIAKNTLGEKVSSKVINYTVKY